jgi:hypothetical protein
MSIGVIHAADGPVLLFGHLARQQNTVSSHSIT